MTICYFGNYNPEEGRNRVYLRGLKQLGIHVAECRTTKRGLAKYLDLISRHRKLPPYDFLIVGYPGHILVPLARILSRRKVVFDALCTLWEGVVISRRYYSRWSPAAWRIWIIDFIAVWCADVVLVETEAQRQFFLKRFVLPSRRVKRVFTGADDSVFYPDQAGKKNQTFTVVFRGKFLPEAGVRHLILAAKILEKEEIDFLILGLGYLESEVKALISEQQPKRLVLVDKHLSVDVLRRQMGACHVAVGQLEDHERLKRTIPHKAFEALALGLPYLTARTAGVGELLTDGKDCLMVSPANPSDLAQKILLLKNSPELRERIALEGHSLFVKTLTPKVLAGQIVEAADQLAGVSGSGPSKVARFLLAGSLGAGVNLFLLYGLVEWMKVSYVLAGAIALGLAMGVSFGLQKWWAFKNYSWDQAPKQLVLFALITIVNFGANVFLLYALTNWGGWHYLLSQVVANLIVAVWSFFIYDLTIFIGHGKD